MYQRFLKGHSVTCGMSGVGSCADNALVEGFFGMLARARQPTTEQGNQAKPNRPEERYLVFGWVCSLRICHGFTGSAVRDAGDA